jgi:flavorubredoxin
VDDLADRPLHPLDDGEVLDLGGHRLRDPATSHVPHGWDAGVCYDETTETLLCGDLFMAVGPAPSFRATAATNSAVKHFYRDRLAAQS